MDKYLKYKKRYLKLRDQIGGGIVEGDLVILNNQLGKVIEIINEDGDDVDKDGVAIVNAAGYIGDIVMARVCDGVRVFANNNDYRKIENIEEIEKIKQIELNQKQRENEKIEEIEKIREKKKVELNQRKSEREDGKLFKYDFVRLKSRPDREGIIISTYYVGECKHAIMATDVDNYAEYDYECNSYMLLTASDREIDDKYKILEIIMDKIIYI